MFNSDFGIQWFKGKGSKIFFYLPSSFTFILEIRNGRNRISKKPKQEMRRQDIRLEAIPDFDVR